VLSTIQEIIKKDPFCAVTLTTVAVVLLLGLLIYRCWFKPAEAPKKDAVKPRAIVIFCSDPRFQEKIAEFIKKKLELRPGEFVPISIGGGPASLANTTTRYYDFKFLKDQIEFFSKHLPTIQEIVLIGHEDCGYYNKILKLPGREKSDLSAARNTIGEFCSKPVWLYYARFSSEDRTEIAFDQVLESNTEKAPKP
jgi:hypothetical protein